jgi:hypothetical protein
METNNKVSLKHRNQIKPIFEMLAHRKSKMNKEEWDDFVKRTEQSIVNSSDQYLSDLPNKDKVIVIHHLFDDFFKEMT